MGSITIYTLGVYLLAFFVITSSYPSLSSSTTEDYNTSISSSSISFLPDDVSTDLSSFTTDDYNALTENDQTSANNSKEKSNSHGTKCVDGLILSAWMPQDHLTVGDRIARGSVYFFALCYLFIGTSIVSDRFMSAIEVITAEEKEVKIRKKNGEVQIVVVRVWNETVANLTLMALGSSAPEILLSIIEIIGKDFQAGDLGPGTIVGSASFNLFVIIAICVSVIPKGESRKIKHLRVFFVTATWSIFAYVWMYLILAYFSPGVVEIWEGLLTLLCFPLTVLTAYIAERRLLVYKYISKEYRMNRRGVVIQSEAESALTMNGHINDVEMKIIDNNELTEEVKDFEDARKEYIAMLKKLRIEYPQSNLEHLEIMAQEQLMNSGPKSRAFYRIQATRKMMGSGNIMRKISERAQSDISEVKAELQRVDIGQQEDDTICRVFFEPGHYTVMESCGEFEMRVVRRGDFSSTITVDYETEDGSAEAGSDYVGKKGTIVFTPGVVEQHFTIEVIDDDVFEQDEHFYVRLSNVSEPAILSTPKVATVMILDDDHGGIFAFSSKDHELNESVGVYEIKVQRYSGARGKVIVPYWTEDGTAKAGKDYEPLHGELEFDNNESEKVIRLVIVEEGSYEKDVSLFVHIGEPEMVGDELASAIEEAEAKAPEDLTEDDKMALLGRPKSGEITKIQIRIRESEEFKNTIDKLVQRANTSMLLGTSSWKEQFIEAWTVNAGGDDSENGDDDDDDRSPSCTDYIMHFITVFWKLLFACIPPTDMYNGYLCFTVSILCIGYVTAIIGDVASHFGCTLGIKDSVTAICIVALGTSLPDTFASKVAAIHDKTADNSIGNVTGSNAVNVFLGIGIAWTIAAVYHAYHGQAFVVDPGSLAFSVTIFLSGALIAFIILLARRSKRIGGELGGPVGPKYATTGILILVWITYLIVSSLEAYGVIKGF